MKIVLEITEALLGTGEAERYDAPYQLRKAARAVLVRDDGMISIQHIKNRGFHKLPGGGIHAGEDIIDGLRRELEEETGCAAAVGDEIGAVIEYRNKTGILQISYCYCATVGGIVGEPKFEKDEIEDGNTAIWVTLEDAIAKLTGENPDEYEGKFIVKRDLAILRVAQNTLR